MGCSRVAMHEFAIATSGGAAASSVDAYPEDFPTEPPTRTTVGAKMYRDILVEIECVAHAPLGAAS